MQSIIFGGGCFWCIEAVFRRLKGVVKVESGYAGGKLENPTYEDVSEGKSGHAEVIKIDFNEEEIKLKKLLEVFFTTHDPTTKDRQGNDIGKQYRSVILCYDDEQMEEVEKFVREIQAEFNRPIVTEVGMTGKFYPAEKYHREYYEKNRENSYCTIVIDPKIRKLKEKFSKDLKQGID